MNIKEFEGNWENFENYFNDESIPMKLAWVKAENAIKTQKKNLIASYLYRNGAKRFWEDACYTVNKENPIKLNTISIKTIDDDLNIKWFDGDDNLIGDYNYKLDSIISKGLEGKENYLYCANSDSCFKWLLLMEPMPNRKEKDNGGLISHFHFQFSKSKENILKGNNKLKVPHWYATMCDKDVSLLQKCNIVLALHKLDTWTKLPE